jgi:hypothetical protein
MARRSPQPVTLCGFCGLPVLWAWNDSKPERLMWLDNEPLLQGGNLMLDWHHPSGREPVAMKRTDPRRPGYVRHECPT